ncbi:hypothetical protein ABZ208_37515 [Streptomyces sp. NPDC006208]|uniref:hypothetical protein n=1 Tax=Streptomyces sp. NPDC006208 TaxID=3156734 RepID=UPI0033A284E4
MDFELPIEVAGLRYPAGDAVPQDHGLECWTFQPYGSVSSALLSNGRVYLAKLPIRRAVTVDTIWWGVGTAGASPVAGQNEVGMYSSAGVLLAATNVDAVISSAAPKATTITPQSLTAGDFVWIGFVFNATTAPTLVRGASFESFPNLNLTASTLRSAVAVASGATALPASFSPAALTTTNSLTLFAGLEAA